MELDKLITINNMIIIVIILLININGFFLENTLADSSTSFYISNSGNDNNPGTSPNQSWKTVTKLNNALTDGTIQPGDDIYFKKGDIWTGTDIRLQFGGTTDNWMIIGAYGTGNNPQFHNNPGLIEDDSSNIHHVKIENFTVTDFNDAGIRFNNNNINNITMKNLHFENGGAIPSIVLFTVDHYIIENCESLNCIQGFVLYGHSPPYQNKNGKILNCTSNAQTDAFTIHEANGQENGANHYLENCVGYSSNEQGFDITSGSNFYLKNCIGYGNKGSIVCGHNTAHTFIDGFHAYDDSNYILAQTDGDHVVARNSIFRDGGTKTIYFCDYGGTTPNNLYCYNNNIIWDSDTAEFTKIEVNPGRYVVLKNNIFYSRTSAPGNFVVVSQGDMVSYDVYFDNNLYWGMGGVIGSHWNSNNINHDLQSWNALPNVQDEIVGNPMFNDPSNNDFKIGESSPCVDAGKWLTHTTDSGSGTTIQVEDAHYFFGGMSPLNIPGDTINIGDDNNLEITTINYNTNTITINRTITWQNEEPIHLNNYHGVKPDIGAFEFLSSQSDPYPEISNIQHLNSNPLDTDDSYGWSNITLEVTAHSGVSSVKLNVIYPNGSSINVSMNSEETNSYYYNTSTIFSECGNYSYYVWAIDSNGNQSTSSVYSFSMPPNWDINKNGEYDLMDLILISNHYNEVGDSGWIREDVDNNGKVKVLDFIYVISHHSESWFN